MFSSFLVGNDLVEGEQRLAVVHATAGVGTQVLGLAQSEVVEFFTRDEGGAKGERLTESRAEGGSLSYACLRPRFTGGSEFPLAGEAVVSPPGNGAGEAALGGSEEAGTGVLAAALRISWSLVMARPRGSRCPFSYPLRVPNGIPQAFEA